MVTLLAASAGRMAAESDAVKRGRENFKEACGFCHGADATGARAPDLVRSPLVNHDANGNLIGPVVRNGRPDQGMPAFPMDDAKLAGIVAFLHAQVEAGLNSAGVPSDYPVVKLLTGDAAAGKKYFEGAAGCAACHTAQRSLAGVARKHSAVGLQQRMLYPAGAPKTVTVTLADGATLNGTLEHLDEFTVLLKDAGGWHHSYARGSVKKVDVHDPLSAHRELLKRYTDADVHNLFAYLETL